mgnify:CR=1 FL=1
MPVIYLRKKFYDKLIKRDENPTEVVNQVVNNYLEKKLSVNIFKRIIKILKSEG